jgi:predicted transcriptional regulator
MEMARHKTPRPTDRELAILKVLWERGPSTVRQVNEAISEDRTTGYTTTLKLMQIMAEKGLVIRDESERTHVYRAKAPQEQMQRQLVGDLMDRAFNGSARKLVMQALAAKEVSARELAKIKQLLDQLKGD